MDDDLWWTLDVPISLITDHTLSPEVRYLYMVLVSQCRPGVDSCSISLRQLADVGGVRATSTVRLYVRKLIDKGWVSISRSLGPRPSLFTLSVPKRPSPTNAVLPVPAALIRNRQLSPAAKCLYTAIAMHSRQLGTDLTIRQPDLAQAAGLSNLVTLRKRVRQLSQTGWLRVSRGHMPRVYRFEPLDPHLASRQSMLRRVEVRLERANYKGEALLKEMLGVVIPDDRFQDNARPGFLVKPLTDESLEFGRWYTKADVAFEFNGPQHCKPTAAYPDPDAVRQQRARDLMKAAIASQLGIHLVTLQPADLAFDRLIARIAGLLPVRELRLEDPVVRYPDQSSHAYVRRVGRSREAKA